MPEVQHNIFAFVDNVRLSAFASAIADPAGTKTVVPGTIVEANRAHTIPGVWEDAGTFETYLPQGAQGVDYARLLEIRDLDTSALWSVGSGSTLADEFRVSEMHLLELGFTTTEQYRTQGAYSVSDPHHTSLGNIRFFDTAITAAVDGTGFEITGGIPAGSHLVWNVHPFAKTAGVGTLDFDIESDTLIGFPAPTTEVSGAQMDETKGGAALRGDAQRIILPGPITNEFFRLAVQSVTGGGTWGIAGTASFHSETL